MALGVRRNATTRQPARAESSAESAAVCGVGFGDRPGNPRGPDRWLCSGRLATGSASSTGTGVGHPKRFRWIDCTRRTVVHPAGRCGRSTGGGGGGGRRPDSQEITSYETRPAARPILLGSWFLGRPWGKGEPESGLSRWGSQFPRPLTPPEPSAVRAIAVALLSFVKRLSSLRMTLATKPGTASRPWSLVNSLVP